MCVVTVSHQSGVLLIPFIGKKEKKKIIPTLQANIENAQAFFSHYCAK